MRLELIPQSRRPPRNFRDAPWSAHRVQISQLRYQRGDRRRNSLGLAAQAFLRQCAKRIQVGDSVCRPADAEVRDLEDAARGEQDIRRPEVQVDQPGFLRRVHSGGDLSEKIERRRYRQRPGGQQVSKRLAVNELHHEERRLPVDRIVVVEDPGQVRVDYRTRSSGLDLELGQHLSVGNRVGAQQLDDDRPGQHQVAGQPHFTEPAGIHQALEPVPVIKNSAVSCHGHDRPATQAPAP
jgi:hypothetical protein